LKHVIISALLKTAASFLLLIALTITYEYVTWLQCDPGDYTSDCVGSGPYVGTKAERRAAALEVGLLKPFKPNLWPFSLEPHVGWWHYINE
jgi:hypothetical protein